MILHCTPKETFIHRASWIKRIEFKKGVTYQYHMVQGHMVVEGYVFPSRKFNDLFIAKKRKKL